MNKVNPSLKRDPSLLPQLFHSELKRRCRSLVRWHSSPAWALRKNRLVETLRQVRSIRIGHGPHRPDDASKSTKLHCSREVQSFVGNAVFGQLGSVTSRKERKFCGGKLRSDDLE